MLLYEIKKQLKRPFVPVFFTVCLLLDICIIFSSQYKVSMVMRENKLAEGFGTAELGEDYAAYVREKYGEEVRYGDFAPAGSGAAIASSCTRKGSNHYLYPYFYESDGSGIYDFVMERSAPAAEKRLGEINENREHLYLSGGADLHEMIYELLSLVIGEAAAFAALCAIRSGGFEHSEGTAQIVYSTKKGRGLCVTKLFAALVISEGFLAALLAVCYVMFFINCPCFELLGSPVLINSDMYFIIPWVSVSVLGYLLLNAGFGAVLTALFALMGYCMWGYIRNIYLACAGTLMLCAAMLFTGLLLPPVPVLRLIGLSSPMMMIVNSPGSWFALSRSSVPIPFFDICSAAGWAALLSVLAALAIKMLRRMKL